MDYIQQFITSTEEQNLNTAKVVRHVFKHIDEDFKDFEITELNNLILNLKPNSPKHITTICYVFGLYAKWLFDQGIVNSDKLYNIIQKLDKKALWKAAKPVATKKFISYKQYLQTIRGIESFEEYNPLYYKTLFSCIYEGIYNDDLSVIKNLRSSDIREDIVTLHEDNGYTYKIKISHNLSLDLKELATINVWQRPNRYGVCQVNMRGLYPDSIFKVEDRATAVDDSYKFTYYAKLRKIAQEYVGYPLSPLQLYTSGIMHRINYLLKKTDVDLCEIFANNSRNRTVHTIVSAELLRCSNKIEPSNFRELVKGHLDTFSDDSFDDLNDDLFEDILDMVEIDELNEFEEGAEILFEHLSYERNAEVVALAKKLFKSIHSKLYCENCGFDFSEAYGTRGEDFIEAHHIKPVSEMSQNDTTKVEDLVMLCSNCHRIIHLKKPWLTMKQLRTITTLKK